MKPMTLTEESEIRERVVMVDDPQTRADIYRLLAEIERLRKLSRKPL